jgi:hypothetical protein
MAKKKRRRPRKRAVTQEQTVQQLRRFQALLDKWLDEQDAITKRQVLAQQKIRQYRKKVKYYQERLEDQAGEAAKALRSIQLEK